MKTLINKAVLFNTVLGIQEYTGSENYRYITFVEKLNHKGNILLFNTLSRQMICLTEEEYSEIENNTRNDIYRQLVEDYFLVPDKYDDFKLKEQYVTLIPLFENKKCLTNFVIMPTMDCNARCFYCFEHDANKYPMSDKTAADTADYIIKNSIGQKVSIQWFGGEPLYNQSAIDIITNKLISENREFKSTMITNGYLFDMEIVERAKNNWNLKNVQITLDGTEEVYNRCKNYIYKNCRSPYYRVLNNIGLLLDAGIKVSIRINMDKHNRDDLYKLVDEIAYKYSEYKNHLSIYAWLLYDNRGTVKNIRDDIERHQLTQELLELERYIEQKGLHNKSLPPSKPKTFSCIADCDNSTVILPDGHLGKCDHHSDDEFWGSIYSDEVDYDVINSWKEKREPVELCKTCPLVPQCNHLKKCPDDGAYDCDEYVQMHRLSKLHRQMKNAYDKYLNEKC